MEVNFTDHVSVLDASSVGQVRRAALMVAQRLSMNETRSGEFALLATEASRNVLIHGGGGQVILTGVMESNSAVGRIVAIDKGPGIANIADAMSDGFSTAGTMGAGLGAMKRMATELEIFTGKGGTAVLIQIGDSPTGKRLDVAGLAIPYPGERVCGDGWTCVRTADRTVLLNVDGLGHGVDAAEAAEEAIVVFRRRVESSPGQILGYIHDALKKTRGAVGAVAEISPGKGRLTYAGVGNISAVVLSKGASRSMVSHNGTLGVAMPRVQEFTSEWPVDGVFVMHSDGLLSKWDVAPYPGLLARQPALIAGVLLRDFRRQRDDVSVIVAKAS